MGRKGSGSLNGAVWAAVLAPAVSVLPALAAKQVGRVGWLVPLAVTPAVLLLAKVLLKLTAERGLSDVILELPGRGAGRALILIYIMWALMLAAARVRLSARRLEFAARQETELAVFVIVPVLMALWLVRGRVTAFVRTAAMFARVLTAALVLLLVLMLFQVRAENLLPVWFDDIASVLGGAVPVFGVLCCGVYGAFLRTGAEQDEAVGWRLVAGCVLLGLLVLVVVGDLGVELTAALEDPFLSLSRQVGVKGAFQRVEGLAAALWLLGDLAFLGLLLWACCRLSETVMPGCGRGWILLIGAGAILLGAGVGFRDAGLARWFEYHAAPWGNLVLGAGVPVGLYVLKWRRGISCA